MKSQTFEYCDLLGFYFSNAGYDVWLGNARSNIFSRKHTFLDPNELLFWQFSWHEIGVYDLSAMIDYILEQTKQTKLIYIGHSQGSTSVFVLLSERPEYNEKIAMVHAMAPPIILKYNHPLIHFLSMDKVYTIKVSLNMRHELINCFVHE